MFGLEEYLNYRHHYDKLLMMYSKITGDIFEKTIPIIITSHEDMLKNIDKMQQYIKEMSERAIKITDQYDINNKTFGDYKD